LAVAPAFVVALSVEVTVPETGWVTADPSTLRALVSCGWSVARTTRCVPALLTPEFVSVVVPATCAALTACVAAMLTGTVPLTFVFSRPAASVERTWKTEPSVPPTWTPFAGSAPPSATGAEIVSRDLVAHAYVRGKRRAIGHLPTPALLLLEWLHVRAGRPVTATHQQARDEKHERHQTWMYAMLPPTCVAADITIVNATPTSVKNQQRPCGANGRDQATADRGRERLDTAEEIRPALELHGLRGRDPVEQLVAENEDPLARDGRDHGLRRGRVEVDRG
jgi:hypothetical protein